MSVWAGKGANLNVQRLAGVGRVESSANDPSVLLMHGVSNGGKEMVEGVQLLVDSFRTGQARCLELSGAIERSLVGVLDVSQDGLALGRVC